MYKIITLFSILFSGFLPAMQARPTSMTKDEITEFNEHFGHIDWRKLHRNHPGHLTSLMQNWAKATLPFKTSKSDKIFNEIRTVLTQEGVQLSTSELFQLQKQVDYARERVGTYSNRNCCAYVASCFCIPTITSCCTSSIPEFLGTCGQYEIFTTIVCCIGWWLCHKKEQHILSMRHLLDQQKYTD